MKGHTVEEMFERVERRTMADHEDCGGVKLPHCLTKPSRDPIHHLLVAFTVGEWIHEMQQATLLDLRRWPPRQITIVAFTKPSITDNRKRAIAESDLGGAIRTGEIRAEDGCEVIVTSTRAEHTGLFLASERQGNVEPARGKACLVVEACRVTLKDQPPRIVRHERDPGSDQFCLSVALLRFHNGVAASL